MLATAELAIVVAAALVGGLIVWFLALRPARAALARAEERHAADAAALEALRGERDRQALACREAETLAARVAPLQDEVAALRARLEETAGRLAQSEAALAAERRGYQAKVEELGRMGEEIERKFAALATEVLGRNSEAFLNLVSERFDRHKTSAEQELEARRQAIEALVKPLAESLVKFERQVGELEKAREGAYRAISEQVRGLAEGQVALRTEAGRLVQALRTPKTRGRWGEFQLRQVLEIAGMSEHVDFVAEATVAGEEGRLRPDVILRLPGGKSIVVDAKTPLDAYLAAIEESDEARRAQHLAQHTRQVKEHVRNLASKEYWRALPEAPDFVVMFVPGEAFFAAAIEQDPGLFEQAMRQRVLLATPTTFVALVKAIAYGWQQEKLAENAQAVAGLGRDLYERIKVFGGHMGEVGRSLRQAVERYNRAVGSLEGRVLPTARRFESLAVTPAGASLDPLEPVELEPRAPQAAELVTAEPGGEPAG